MQQLVDNCEAYNTPGHGAHGNPQLIPLANALLWKVDQLLGSAAFAEELSYLQAVMEVRPVVQTRW